MAPLEQLGDSVLVVGDQTTLKIHVHTDDPERGHRDLCRGRRWCRTSTWPTCASRCASATSDWRSRSRSAACGALAVISGEGMRTLFEGLGVRVLDGGPTLNPSTYDLLAAIHAIEAEEVVVLPNSANVVMAAERAAELSDKTVSRGPVALAAGRARRRGQPRPGPQRGARTPPR